MDINYATSIKSILTAIDVIKSIYTILPDTKLIIKDNTLEIRTVDPAHVALVNIKLPSEKECNDTQIAISLSDLEAFAKTFPSKSLLNFLGNDETKLYIECNNIKGKMPLFDIESIIVPKIPTVDFNATVTINTKDVYQFIKTASTITDYTMMFVEQDDMPSYDRRFKMLAEGDKGREIERTFLDKDGIEIKMQNNVKVKFSLEYLEKMFKTLNRHKAEQVTLNLRTDGPMSIEFKIPLESRQLEGFYMLAPRVDN